MKPIDVRRLPGIFKEIRLERALDPGYSGADRAEYYIMLIPLESDGHIDADVAAQRREDCRVTKFAADGDLQHGVLVRRPGGSWVIHYDAEEQEADEPGYRFGDHRFVAGEYVTLQEDDSEHTYRVASVTTPHR